MANGSAIPWYGLIIYPIAFMITSFETEYDFDRFYCGLIDLAEQLDLNFDTDYIMQDSAEASYNSAQFF